MLPTKRHNFILHFDISETISTNLQKKVEIWADISILPAVLSYFLTEDNCHSFFLSIFVYIYNS